MTPDSAQPSPAKAPLILTIDIGTSSTRAILFDAEAHVVEGMVEQQPTQMATTLDGGATFEADALTETVVAVIDALLERAGEQAAHEGEGHRAKQAIDTHQGSP